LRQLQSPTEGETLPRSGSPDPDPLPTAVPVDRVAEGPVTETEAGPATILVVDDEQLARLMLTDLLEAQGFRVISVARGEDVFPLLDQVDLVLLDAMLPGRDGWSICREIKKSYDPLLPIIMVTARTASDDVVRTFDAGADDYVAKPFHVAELTARIETRLRVRRAELALQAVNRQLRDLADQNYQLYAQAKRDAEERAQLLREIDHRVRNNISVILGLVIMERNRRPARPTEEALASLELRLRSFLLVYESLRHRRYSGLVVRDIVERLAQRLRSVLRPGEDVGLEISGPAVVLDERRGFALALVMNELLANAFQHAFPNGRRGTVGVRIEQTDDEYRLEVYDDGKGTTCNGDRAVLGSGRSIVDALVRSDLGGRVEYLPAERGTCVRVVFPRNP